MAVNNTSSSQASPPRLWTSLPFYLLLLLLILYYGFYLWPRDSLYRFLTWDAYRDIIMAQHILAGGSPIHDPSFKDMLCWYPPLNAWCSAFFIWLFHLDVFRFYAVTPSLLLWLFPLSFYLLFRRSNPGRPWIGLIATLSLCAMPWAVTYVFASPVVMANATAIAFLLLFLYIQIDKTWQAVIFGVALGILSFHHPPTFLILFASILFRCLFQWLVDKKAFVEFKNDGFVLTISMFISLVYFFPNLLQPILNPDPIRYIAPGFQRTELFLPGTSWLRSLPFFALVIVGIVETWRNRYRKIDQLWLGIIAVSILGQIPAICVILTERFEPSWSAWTSKLPIVLPHEFQMYSQIAIAWFTGVGLVALRKNLRSYPGIFYSALTVLLLSLSFSLTEFPQRSQVFLYPHRLQQQWKAPVQWIRQNTDVYDVFCVPDNDTAFHIIGVRTGRKTLLNFATHSNPHADLERRRQARTAVYSQASIDEIVTIRDEYGLNYILSIASKVTPQRQQFFHDHFPIVYDDGIVTIYTLDTSRETP